MKKGLLITLDFPPQKGGVASYLVNVCKNFPADRIVVLAPRGGGDVAFDRQQSFKIYRQPLLFQYFWPQWLKMIFLTWPIVRKEGIGVIQISHILPVGYIAYFFKKIFGLPYLVYTHGLDLLQGKKTRWKKFFTKFLLKRADWLVANSEFTKKILLQLGISPDKIKVVYPCPNVTPNVIPAPQQGAGQAPTGIPSFVQGQGDPDLRQDDSIRQDDRRGGERKVLLTVGRLVKRKGHDSVLRSLPIVLQKISHLVYFIVGQGPEETNLRSIVKELNLERNVFFACDRLTDETIAAFYQLCDIFIMLPREVNGDIEGFGIVYTEANSFGKPVIATDSGGVGEAVKDGRNGLIVPAENTTAIAEAIIRLCADETLARALGENGRQRVNQELQWQKQVEKIKRLLY